MYLYYRIPQPAVEATQQDHEKWLDNRIARAQAELRYNEELTDDFKRILMSVNHDMRANGAFATYAAELLADHARITADLNDLLAEKGEANA